MELPEDKVDLLLDESVRRYIESYQVYMRQLHIDPYSLQQDVKTMDTGFMKTTKIQSNLSLKDNEVITDKLQWKRFQELFSRTAT